MGQVKLEEIFAVNPFTKMIEIDKRPEQIPETESISDEAIKRTISLYTKLKKDIGIFDPTGRVMAVEVLTPQQIQLSLWGILSTDYITPRNDLIRVFMTKLIKTSYDAGHNNFILNTLDESISIRLEIREENPITPIYATIIGNVPSYFGMHSKNAVYNISGNAGNNCGWGSRNCMYIIKGDIEGCFGASSANCSYDISGDVPNRFASQAYNCIYTFRGRIIDPIYNDVKKSTFKVLSQKNYELLSGIIPSTNTIQLIDDCGKIVEETKK